METFAGVTPAEVVRLASSGMRISELIRDLRNALRAHGDVDVGVGLAGGSWHQVTSVTYDEPSESVVLRSSR